MSVTINISENTDAASSAISSISTEVFDLEPPPPTRSVEAATNGSDEMPVPPAPADTGEDSDMSFNNDVPSPPNDAAGTGNDAANEDSGAAPPEENAADQATETALYDSTAIALTNTEENDDGAIPPAVAASEGRAELNLADLHMDPPAIGDEPNVSDDFAGDNFDAELPPGLEDESNNLEAPAKKAASKPKKKK